MVKLSEYPARADLTSRECSKLVGSTIGGLFLMAPRSAVKDMVGGKFRHCVSSSETAGRERRCVMGWMFVVGNCIACGKLISFNAELVPSVVVRGTREPVCRECIERANPQRKKNGLPEIVILPGAYEAGEVA